MQLNLTKPLAFFDLETTGINVSKDRIVELSVLKVMPDGTEIKKTWLINPTIPIPEKVTKIHGISDKDVKDKPTFKDLASEILDFFGEADLVGYNSNKFDIPLLVEEFLRAECDFDVKNRRFIDGQVIFFKKEPRTLSAAYEFYCGKKLENAHSAEADVFATYEVLKAQIERYDDLKNDVTQLSKFSSQSRNADFAGMIIFNEDGVETFNFGKHKGKTVREVLEKEPGYYSWIMGADFPLYTKKILTPIYMEVQQKRKETAKKQRELNKTQKEKENKNLSEEELKNLLSQKFKVK
ncbi:MAG: 3'-5' exonuclease [Bacteroidales bacterium]|nr:3'-5' exonuclease [Bacteroidales bacterium]